MKARQVQLKPHLLVSIESYSFLMKGINRDVLFACFYAGSKKMIRCIDSDTVKTHF